MVSTVQLSPDLPYSVLQQKKRQREVLKTSDNNSSSVSKNTTIAKYQDPATTPNKKRKFVEDKVGSLKKELKTHFKTKMDLVALTLAVTANTKYHFEQGFTHAQGPSSHPVFINVDGGNHKLIMNATHSSAIPVLYAYDRQEWEDYEKGLIPKPEGKIYLKYSGYDFHQNSTIDLPFANGVDILIEGKGDDDKFRSQLLKIINAAAKGDISFSEGIQQAHITYEQIIDDILQGQFSTDPLSQREQTNKKVLEIFKKHVQKDREMLGDYRFEDRILGFRPTQHLNGEGRAALYKARCDLIRRRYKLESQLNSHFQEVKGDALGNIKRKPHAIERALRMITMETATPELSFELGRHFSTSLEELKTHQDLAQGQKFLAKKTLDTEIDQFLKIFEEGIETRENIDQNYFGQVLNTFMNESGINSYDLCNRFNRQFNANLTLQQLEDILEGKEKADLLMAKRFARILKADVGFFFSDHFEELDTSTRKRLDF